MKTRTTIQLLLITSLVFASSCSFTKGRQLAESGVEQFHKRFNAGEIHEIYIESDVGFQKWGDEAKVNEFLSAIHRKLGTIQDAHQTGWRVYVTTDGTVVRLGYDVDFSEGKGTEEFAFLVKGDKALLYKYNVNSPLLITR